MRTKMQQKLILYVHGISTGENLAAKVAERPGVVSAKPLNMAENPLPSGEQRNEALVLVYDDEKVLPTKLETFIENLGYEVVAQESGPVTDQL